MQLPSYNYAKSVIVRNGWLKESSYWTYLASSSVSGICVVGVCFMMAKVEGADATWTPYSA